MDRRRFLTGALAVPLVVRSGLLMPVKPVYPDLLPYQREALMRLVADTRQFEKQLRHVQTAVEGFQRAFVGLARQSSERLSDEVNRSAQISLSRSVISLK